MVLCKGLTEWTRWGAQGRCLRGSDNEAAHCRLSGSYPGAAGGMAFLAEGTDKGKSPKASLAHSRRWKNASVAGPSWGRERLKQEAAGQRQVVRQGVNFESSKKQFKDFFFKHGKDMSRYTFEIKLLWLQKGTWMWSDKVVRAEWSSIGQEQWGARSKCVDSKYI